MRKNNSSKSNNSDATGRIEWRLFPAKVPELFHSCRWWEVALYLDEVDTYNYCTLCNKEIPEDIITQLLLLE